MAEKVSATQVDPAPLKAPPPAMLQEDPENERGTDLGQTMNTLQNQKKIPILIPSTENEKGDVPVAINGYTYLIQRDKRVEVPESILQVLDQAKMTLYTQRRREDGQGMELLAQEVLRFPYQRF